MGNSASDDFLTQEGKTTEEGKEKIRNYLIEKGISVDDDVIHDNTLMYELAIKTVRQHFQGSRSSAETLDRVARVLEKIGCDADNTLFAQSICPDEINHGSFSCLPCLYSLPFQPLVHMTLLLLLF